MLHAVYTGQCFLNATSWISLPFAYMIPFASGSPPHLFTPLSRLNSEAPSFLESSQIPQRRWPSFPLVSIYSTLSIRLPQHLPPLTLSSSSRLSLFYPTMLEASQLPGPPPTPPPPIYSAHHIISQKVPDKNTSTQLPDVSVSNYRVHKIQ